MTTPLPPYGTAARCAKCTCPDIDDSYQPGRPTIVHTSQGAELLTTHNPTGGECLLRTCRDCGWAWLEACADATPTRDGGDPDETSSDFFRRIGAMPCGGTYTVTSEDGRTSNPIPYNAPPGFDPGWAPEAPADAELVTEIDTGRGKIEFAQPVTRAWVKDYADRFLRGVPPTLLPQDAP